MIQWEVITIRIETFGEGVKGRLLEVYGTGDGLEVELPKDKTELRKTLLSITKEYPTEMITTAETDEHGFEIKLAYINGEVGVSNR